MLTVTAALALVMAYLALVVSYLALRTLARLRRAAVVLTKGVDREHRRRTLIELTEEQIRTTRTVATEVEAIRAQVETSLAYAVRNVALVRFDAFDDMAGRMSFSVALLDDNGDGITLSSIAGHSDTRMYAKGIRAGRGEHELSPEEHSAVSAAIRNRTARPTTSRRATRRAS